MNNNSDSELWEKFKRGDEQSFTYIFDTYHLQLFEYGRRLTSDEHLVKDSIQDLFFELASKKSKLSKTDNILYYLLKSIRQKIVRNLRKNTLKKHDYDENSLHNFMLNYSTNVNDQEKENRIDKLAEAINKLPPRQKEVIYLKFYKSFSNKQVAKIMNVKYQSVGNNLQKAIHKLKNLLNTNSNSAIMFFLSTIKR